MEMKKMKERWAEDDEMERRQGDEEGPLDMVGELRRRKMRDHGTRRMRIHDLNGRKWREKEEQRRRWEYWQLPGAEKAAEGCRREADEG